MSVRYSTAVWDCDGLRGTAKLVALKFADCCNDEGYCWPSLRTVAVKCGVARSTVQTIVRDLQNAGVLELIEGDNGPGKKYKSRQYRFDLRALKTIKSATDNLPDDRAGPDDTGPESGQDRPGERAGTGPESGHNPSLEPSVNPGAGARAAGQPGGPAAPASAPGREGGQAGDPAGDQPGDGREKAAWQAVLPRLRQYWSKAKIVSWIGPMIVEADDGQTITLLAPGDLHRKRFLTEYVATVRRLVGREWVDVRVSKLPRAAHDAEAKRVQQLLD